LKRVIDVLAQITVKVIDVLAFLGYRCPGTCHLFAALVGGGSLPDGVREAQFNRASNDP
jgi:hypothetical protein